MKKKLFLQTFGWPLFRDCDTFRQYEGRDFYGRGDGFPGVGGRVAIGIGGMKER